MVAHRMTGGAPPPTTPTAMEISTGPLLPGPVIISGIVTINSGVVEVVPPRPKRPAGLGSSRNSCNGTGEKHGDSGGSNDIRGSSDSSGSGVILNKVDDDTGSYSNNISNTFTNNISNTSNTNNNTYSNITTSNTSNIIISSSGIGSGSTSMVTGAVVILKSEIPKNVDYETHPPPMPSPIQSPDLRQNAASKKEKTEVFAYFTLLIIPY